MKIISVTLAASLLASTACANLQTNTPSREPVTVAARPPSVHSSDAVQFVEAAIDCMLGEGDGARCDAVASRAQISATLLREGNVATLDDVSERLTRIARSSPIDPESRQFIPRWFDVASGAIRESRRADAGARSHALNATVSEGRPGRDDLEASAATDRQGLRDHRQLAALFALIDEAGELAPDVELSALLVFAHRVEATASARPQVRTDAIETIAEILRDVGGIAPNAISPNTSGDARDGDIMLAAHSLVASRLQRISPRLDTSWGSTSISRLRTATATNGSDHSM